MPRISWIGTTVLILASIPAGVFAETIPDQFVFGGSGIGLHGPFPGGIYIKQLLLTSAAGEIALDFYSAGFRDSLGNTLPSMESSGEMITGWCRTLCFHEFEYRAWIAFRVPDGGPYTSASLRLAEWRVAAYPGNTETVAFYDVGTPVPLLRGDEPVAGAFDDLGSGMLYGTQDLPAFVINGPNYASPVFTIPLNNAALAAINNARGDYFAMGTRLASVDLLAPEPNVFPAFAAVLAFCIGFRRHFAQIDRREAYRP